MMTTYQMRHQTVYDYSEPVPICQNELRMRPRVSEALQRHQCHVDIDPTPETMVHYMDYFGNEVDSFAIESPHRSLSVLVSSRVSVRSRSDDDLGCGPDWNDLVKQVRQPRDEFDWQAAEFTHSSRRIDLLPQYGEFARDIFQSTPSLLDACRQLTQKIHDIFQYDATATGVDTSTEEAFDLRAGVCQDFSHVQIACLRRLGIPARYVSGYLRTQPPPGKPRLVGADQSHAWVSVYAGQHLGWVDFDPTNACRATVDHIPICIGRDYDDISPMRGIVLGGGNTVLKVSVDVVPVDEASIP